MLNSEQLISKIYS